MANLINYEEDIKKVFHRYFTDDYKVEFEIPTESIETKHITISEDEEEGKIYITKHLPESVSDKQIRLKINLIIMELEELFIGVV